MAGLVFFWREMPTPSERFHDVCLCIKRIRLFPMLTNSDPQKNKGQTKSDIRSIENHPQVIIKV